MITTGKMFKIKYLLLSGRLLWPTAFQGTLLDVGNIVVSSIIVWEH